MLDKCAVSWDKVKESDAAMIFVRVKEDVKNLANSRRDMVNPKPMDVDKIAAEWNNADESNYYEEEKFDVEKDEVCYVAKGAKTNYCTVCGKFGHSAGYCWSGRGETGQYGLKAEIGPWTQDGMKSGKNYQNQKGKNKKDWTKPKASLPWKGWSTGSSSSTWTKLCFRCGSSGHIVKDCVVGPD